MNRVLVIGDVHAPFTCIDTLTFIYQYASDFKPDVIIQVGDLYDCFSWSKFPSPILMSPKHELEMGRELASNMWKNLQLVAPGSDCYQLWGNHEARVKKRILETLPALDDIYSFKEFMSFPKVTTMLDEKELLVFDNTVYHHGYWSKLGDGLNQFIGFNVAAGHSHRGGTFFKRIRGEVFWELNAGFCADDKQRPLQYGNTRTNLWTRGVGSVCDYGPRFIPVTK